MKLKCEWILYIWHSPYIYRKHVMAIKQGHIYYTNGLKSSHFQGWSGNNSNAVGDITIFLMFDQKKVWSTCQTEYLEVPKGSSYICAACRPAFIVFPLCFIWGIVKIVIPGVGRIWYVLPWPRRKYELTIKIYVL